MHLECICDRARSFESLNPYTSQFASDWSRLLFLCLTSRLPSQVCALPGPAAAAATAAAAAAAGMAPLPPWPGAPQRLCRID
eukprot:6175100-Pleurochrysis_carterae.AAC.3